MCSCTGPPFFQQSRRTRWGDGQVSETWDDAFHAEARGSQRRCEFGPLSTCISDLYIEFGSPENASSFGTKTELCYSRSLAFLSVLCEF